MSLRLFWQFVRLRMKERMEYRAAYFLQIVAQIWGYSAQYLAIWLLLHRFQTIHGWSWPQIAFLYSLDLFTYALGAAFTFSPMTELEQMVEQGTFDGVLVLPSNPYIYLTARMYNLGYLAHVILSGAVLIWAVTQLSLHWTALTLLFLILTILSGVMLQAAALTLLGACAFLFIQTRFLFNLYYNFKSFIAYPMSAYGTFIQILLTAIIPLAFINFYPATVLLSKNGQLFPGWLGWLAPLIGPISFCIAYQAWMHGVNKYQSAGG